MYGTKPTVKVQETTLNDIGKRSTAARAGPTLTSQSSVEAADPREHGRVRPPSSYRPAQYEKPHESVTVSSRPSFADSDDRPVTTAPSTPKRLTARQSMTNLKHEVMVHYLYQKQATKTWIGHQDVEGVILRRGKGDYLACPPQLLDTPFGQACVEMNLPSVMTVSSRPIKTLLACSEGATDVPLKDGLRMQIVQTVADLSKARKAQCGAFIAENGLLVVWDDDARHLVKRAEAVEEQTRQIVWQMNDNDDDQFQDVMYNKEGVLMDNEAQVVVAAERPTHLMNTTLVAFCLIIVIVLLGLAARSLATEIAVDKNYVRLAFLALIPVQIFFTLFFAQVIVGCISQCCGPVKQMQENSRFYSAVRSPRLRSNLPHVTIQCPVYKEGLAAVIEPTVKSIKQAISTYELQGGSANIFINDDGMQLISEEEQQARKDFYADNGIGWTARPKHGSEGFVRKGKFKKASNMNYGLMLSCAVEEKLLRYSRHALWTQDDENSCYETCLAEVLAEKPRAWCQGNIRVGDYILLIDSDTRVPIDCLLDAASEMEQSPNVGIMQFSSGVMQVVHDFFENGITFFTNMIYTAIEYTVANGDVAPFVGHNAILRWSAIQQVSYTDEDNYEKFWSESHVSEDFDMSLRLQCDGYIIRLAAWAEQGFKEGVSLTVYDELARWEKYAYGKQNSGPEWAID